ncbi:MAG: amino acid ABC transporter permease [Candidatus Dormibacteraeota bacterium]|nr:amino acid ABC transporter permease [Candidatus Dormibacteraeota bacterium]
MGLLIGLLVALMRDSRLRLLRGLSWTYVWIFRGIPTLIQLFIVWYALPQLFPAFREQWFSPFLAATIALSFNEAAYAAEIMRGGLLAVDDGQKVAARALGMTPFKVFSKVVAPQLTRVAIPPMANDFITLLKITSLASVVSVRELMTNTQTAVASSFRFAEWYLAAALYYLVLVSIFMLGQAWLERRYVWTSRVREPRSIMRAIGR